jgi:hypothetical protein
METSHGPSFDDADFTPFVNEECGDTMWDEVLNQEPAKPQNYASLAFTEPVKAVQEEHHSRTAYERMEQVVVNKGFTKRETDFISQRDSFYLATMGENGFPYIQHRGGPKGFVQVLDEFTLGFVDFSGNRQYISVGNLKTHSKVSLIMMDYARQARLKMYAEAEIISLNENPELLKKLCPAHYKHTPERLFVLHVKAFDWNCPQHITPRYTLEEFREMMEEND